MKLIYLYTIGIFIMFMSPSSYLCAQGVAENNQFFDWKESDYKAYEDSLLKALYPPVIAKTAENPHESKIRSGTWFYNKEVPLHPKVRCL